MATPPVTVGYASSDGTSASAAFVTRALAVRWATLGRQALEKGEIKG
jgi:hypothetical protein